MPPSFLRPPSLAAALAALAGCAELPRPTAPWNPPPYFAQECWADIGGVRVCYLEAGVEREEAMVFIHGWSGNVHNWWDQYEYFSRRRHVLVFDLPGHGKSDKPADVEAWMELWVRTVDELMDRRGIERAVVVGNSVGGNVAARLAIARPERVQKLVLSDPTGSGRDGIIKWVIPTMRPAYLQRAGLTTGEHFPGDDPKSRARAAMIRSYVGTAEEAPYLQALSDSFAASYSRIPAAELAKIRAPTLLVWGDEDPVVPRRAVRYFRRRIPDTRTFSVADGGHNPNTEAPTIFNCVLEAFVRDADLARCGGGRVSGPSTNRARSR
jgi:pimeloyl-ACP methyl ester carboxylesterase